MKRIHDKETQPHTKRKTKNIMENVVGNINFVDAFFIGENKTGTIMG